MNQLLICSFCLELKMDDIQVQLNDDDQYENKTFGNRKTDVKINEADNKDVDKQVNSKKKEDELKSSEREKDKTDQADPETPALKKRGIMPTDRKTSMGKKEKQGCCNGCSIF